MIAVIASHTSGISIAPAAVVAKSHSGATTRLSGSSDRSNTNGFSHQVLIARQATVCVHVALNSALALAIAATPTKIQYASQATASRFQRSLPVACAKRRAKCRITAASSSAIHRPWSDSTSPTCSRLSKLTPEMYSSRKSRRMPSSSPQVA